MDTPFMLKLSHLQTGKPTYVKANDITCVRSNTEGKTLVLLGDSGQYVTESVDEVLLALGQVGFEIV